MHVYIYIYFFFVRKRRTDTKLGSFSFLLGSRKFCGRLATFIKIQKMSSSDSDMAGSEAQPLVLSRDMYGPPSMASDFLCYLCLKPHQVDKKYKTVCLHRECLDAVRCHNRLLANRPTLLKEADRMMIVEPEPWRNKLLPLVGTREGGRDKQHLKAMKSKYEEVEDVEFAQDAVDEEVSLVDEEEYLERKRGETTHDIDSDEAREEYHFLLDEQHKQGKKPQGSDGQYRLQYGKVKYKLKSSRGMQKNIKKVKRKDFDKQQPLKTLMDRQRSPGRSSCPSTLSFPGTAGGRPKSQPSLTAMLEDSFDDKGDSQSQPGDDVAAGLSPEMAEKFRSFLKEHQKRDEAKGSVAESPSKDDDVEPSTKSKRQKKIVLHAGIAEEAAQGRVLNSTEFLQAKVALAMSTKSVESQAFSCLDVPIKMVTFSWLSLMAYGQWLIAQGSLLGQSVCKYVFSSGFCKEHICAHIICVQVALRTGFENLSKVLDGKKGFIAQIRALKAALVAKAEDLAQFDKHPDVVIEALQVFSKELATQAAKINSSRKADIGPLQLCS